MPQVRSAEQPGVGKDGVPRPSEDRIVVLPNAVLVLDGATAASPQAPDPAVYVDALAAELGRGLPEDRELADLLAAAIAALPPEATGATSTVAMLRWTEHEVQALALADSVIVLFGQSEEVVTDHRLARLRAAGVLTDETAVRRLRNTSGGFWVAGADPAVAAQAVLARRPRGAIRAALVCTDGVSTGVDDYRLFDWAGALELARRDGPGEVLARVRAAERADAQCRRWPRNKVHDDQALALVEFD